MDVHTLGSLLVDWGEGIAAATSPSILPRSVANIQDDVADYFPSPPLGIELEVVVSNPETGLKVTDTNLFLKRQMFFHSFSVLYA